jgi:hypothetical protein
MFLAHHGLSAFPGAHGFWHFQPGMARQQIPALSLYAEVASERLLLSAAFARCENKKFYPSNHGQPDGFGSAVFDLDVSPGGLAGPLFNNPVLAYYLRLFAIYPLITLPTVSTDAILIGLDRTKHAALFEIATKTAMVVAVAAAGSTSARSDFQGAIVHGVAQSLWAFGWSGSRCVE